MDNTYSELYKNFKYTIDIKYAISSFIREYDMSKANINILYYYGVLDKNQYNYYYNLEKKKREVAIGYLQKDKKIADTLKNGFLEFRRRFFESNNIQDHEVISIKNDAIYLLNKIPSQTQFDNIIFLNKNTYTSFYKLNNTEFYYFLDQINNIEKLDIKGINDNKLELHENYFLEFLKVCFCAAQTEDIIDVLDIVKTFYNKYINLELDVEYYREFNSNCSYSIKPMFKYFGNMKCECINKRDIKMLDISYNLNLIRELYQIYSNIYFSQKKI